MNRFQQLLQNKEPFAYSGKSFNNLASFHEALQTMGQILYKEHNNAKKNDFYNWVLHAVGDTRLARDIRNIRVQENMIDIVGERIEQLKLYAKHPEKSVIEKRIDMYTEHVVFSVDNEVCSDCEICSLSCPKEAVEIIDGKKTVNDDCTKCGFCVELCPLDCMSLAENGKKKEFYKEHKMIPKLPDMQDVNGTQARRLFTGSYTVEGKCPPGCELCVQACPINIITRFDGDKELSKVHVWKEQCLLCGACKNACPYGIIKSERSHIFFEGEEYCGAWNNALQKLLRPDAVQLYHNGKNLRKIAKLVEKSGMRKY